MIAMVKPALKSSELIQVLAAMYQSDSIDEFTIKRARVEADKLLKAGFLDGHVIHALIDCLALDVDSFMAHYDIVQKRSSNPVDLMNMVKCLSRLAYNSKAFSLFESILKHYPDDLEVLKLGINVSLQSLNFVKCSEYFGRLEKLGSKDLDPDDLSISRIVKRLVNLMNDLNLQDLDFQELLDVSSAVIRSQRVAVRGVNIVSGLDGNVSLKFAIISGAERAIEISFEIAETIISKLENNFNNILTVGCIPSK